MTNLNDQLANTEFDGELAADAMLTDVIVLARATNMETGRGTVLIARSDGMDSITHLGLLECARQVFQQEGWTDAYPETGDV